jgi:hypothetical protein
VIGLLLWVSGGVVLALGVLWLLSRSSRSGEVMERLAASSPDRPAAFGRPSASVWDQESKASREGAGGDEEPPAAPRRKGEPAP